jgi:hypothetical protein
MRATSKNPYKSKLFPRSRNEDKVPVRGVYQRFIISSLALQLSSMTRRALAKLLAQKFGVSMRSGYEHVMKELEECLIPDGIVEVADTVPSVRGPRIYRTRGIPCYRLSSIGILIAASLDEINIDERKKLLRRFLMSENTLTRSLDEHGIKEEILDHLQEYPQFTLELVEKGVSQFMEGRLKHPLDVFLRS